MPVPLFDFEWERPVGRAALVLGPALVDENNRRALQHHLETGQRMLRRESESIRMAIGVTRDVLLSFLCRDAQASLPDDFLRLIVERMNHELPNTSNFDIFPVDPEKPRYAKGSTFPPKTETSLLPAEEAEFERYQPLRLHTGLFRHLVETEPTEEGCLQFAEQYGLLGPSARRNDVSPPAAESIHIWKAGIRWLGYLVQLWDLFQAGDRAELRRYLELTKAGVRLRHLPEDRFDIPQSPVLRVPVRQRPRGVLPDSWENEAQPLTFSYPNFSPEENAAKLLVALALDDMLASQVRCKFGVDPVDDTLALQFVPQDLWGAIILQFASAVAGDRHYTKCRECRTWFELRSGVSRSDKIYCSNACRTRAGRGRKALALRLHAAGKSIAEIADRTGAEPQTIKTWIKNSKQ